MKILKTNSILRILKIPHKKQRDYVNGPQLHRNILAWYESEKDEIPFDVFDPCMKICERLGLKGNFAGYTYIDEMIDAAKIMVLSSIRNKKYDPYRFSNPFAYFTQVAYNEFRRVLNDESRHSYIKHKSLISHFMDLSLEGVNFMDDNSKEYQFDSEQMDKLINKHEKKKREPKSKPIEKKTKENRKMTDYHLIPEIVKNIGKMADPDNMISGDNQRGIAQKQLLVIEQFCKDLIRKYNIKK